MHRKTFNDPPHVKLPVVGELMNNHAFFAVSILPQHYLRPEQPQNTLLLMLVGTGAKLQETTENM
jgi:hypothetical protein